MTHVPIPPTTAAALAAAVRLVHASPPDDSGLTPCCGRTPFELPATDRMTLDPSLVTCTATTPGDPACSPTPSDDSSPPSASAVAETGGTSGEALARAFAIALADDGHGDLPPIPEMAVRLGAWDMWGEDPGSLSRSEQFKQAQQDARGVITAAWPELYRCARAHVLAELQSLADPEAAP